MAGAQHLNLEFGHQKRNIQSKEHHINWDSSLFNDDIGLITVSEPFDFSDPHVQPIDTFKFNDTQIAAETVCNSTGWGVTFGGSFFPSNTLKWIQIPTHSQDECQEIYPGVEITKGMICAGMSGTTTCNVSNASNTNDESNYVYDSMFDRSKPKIGFSSSITNK